MWLPWSLNFGAIFLVFNLPTSDVRVSPFFYPVHKKMHLIHLVLGGFTNIAIRQSQCFYCALDPKIEAALTADPDEPMEKALSLSAGAEMNGQCQPDD